ncbi:hypothetical protein C0J52_08334 [Blattella germanica]|nr:hypothetical protein C0J52_08334 [Blattella germanica]
MENDVSMKMALCIRSSQKCNLPVSEKVLTEGIFINEKPTKVKCVLTKLDEVVYFRHHSPSKVLRRLLQQLTTDNFGRSTAGE